MTILELSQEFDLMYNNILSNAAPGLSEYEKSVLLTEAQLEFVIGVYNGTLAESFESTEQAKSFLDVLVKDVKIDPEESNGNILDSVYDKLYKLPPDYIFIVYEALITNEPVGCQGAVADIVPSSHDFILRDLRNPFKCPTRTKALRLSLQMPSDSGASYSEILSGVIQKQYHIRYVRRPQPIILEDLSQYDLTIEGKTEVSNYSFNGLLNQACELNPATHRLILEIAVKKAVLLFNSTKSE